MLKKAWIAAVAVAFVGLGAVAAPLTGDIVGTWINIDPQTSGMAQIVILPSETGGLNVFGYGVCSPSYCEWGATPLYLASAPVTWGDPEWGIAIWEIDAVRMILVLQHQGEFLVAELFVFWTDGTGTPYRDIVLLRKVE